MAIRILICRRNAPLMHNPPSPSFRIICASLAGLLYTPAWSAPLLTVDQNPLTAIYGLPLPLDARLPQEGAGNLMLSVNISNMLIIDESPSELLLMDGETHRTNLVFDRGLSEHWSLRLQLSWIEHVPGFMDRPIDRFHEIFGMREGDRPTQPRDRLLFAFQSEGEPLLHIDSTRAGAGDPQLILSRQLHRTERTAWSFSGGVKAPTGDSARLTGSGAADTSVWTSAWWQISPKVESTASAGLLFPGEGDILTAFQTDQVAFGHAGLQWRAWPETALRLQLDWHTNFYENTDSAFLGDVMQLSFGGTWRLTRDTELDFTLTEDIKVDASPDANFNISLRLGYK